MSSRLDRRLAALATAVELAEGRLEGGSLERAREVVQRAGERLEFGTEATVVALAGPTGAGKSTLFNALAGEELAKASVRRPTTAQATAAIWGEAPHALLDWLDVRTRHHVDNGAARRGLVLLDLPDFDSVERGHRLEAERLIGLVDLLVWVVDPQKYADASLHERYLKPLHSHSGAMAVVLNQADRLDGVALDRCRADLEQLLERDGLSRVPVLALSATSEDGLAALNALLDERVALRRAAIERLAGDVQTAAEALAVGCGSGTAAGVDRRGRNELVATLGDVAGVSLVVRAVARSHERRGALAVGWPFLRWIRALRPDPLGRLRLGGSADEDVRTSLPAPSAAQLAQADSALRTVALRSAGELPDPWPRLLRAAGTAREPELVERLDQAIAGTQLPRRRPLWWALGGVLQKALALVAVAGALWLAVIVALGFLQLDATLPLPELEGLPLPTLLLVGGLVLGALFAWAGRIANGIGARRRAARAKRALHARVEEVTGELVIEPLEAEIQAHERLCGALGTARSR
ncbi:MAG: 50S ribosome-binding GTPase [Actinomycetota bacterium]|nr:50S ribosome-binding GTPase [Actinomycetota bacterium]